MTICQRNRQSDFTGCRNSPRAVKRLKRGGLLCRDGGDAPLRADSLRHQRIHRTRTHAGRMEVGQETLAEVADHAKQYNVTLVVGYLNRFECYFLNCAEDAARFVREVGHSHLKTMYDTFHANIEGHPRRCQEHAGPDGPRPHLGE
ncbi:MAG: TIM barrel protein [Planctomycetaceae bacterium]